jgi:hypothetical protein
LLLEAGSRQPLEAMSVPPAWPTLEGTSADWADTTVMQTATGTALTWPRGRALGGSSAINGMNFVRGHRGSYDAWAEVGSGAGVTSTPSNPYTDAPADPPQRIDYVLVLQGTRPLATPVEARVIGDRPTEEGVYGSDHFGLVVDLELRSRPTAGGHSQEHDARAMAQDLCARIARVRSKIRELRKEARAELERARRPLRYDQTGGCPGAASAQWLREATLAKVRAAFGAIPKIPTKTPLSTCEGS